jgi:hypothetical protein
MQNHSAVFGWQVRSLPRSEHDHHRAWLDLASAVSCWPEQAVTVERRFVKTRGRGRPREYVLAAVDGGELLASRAVLGPELARLCKPLCKVQAMQALPPAALARVLRGSRLSEAAELRTVTESAPEGLAALRTQLDALLEAASDCGHELALGIALGSPPQTERWEWDAELDTSPALELSDAPLVTMSVRPPTARRPVRFRLRVLCSGPIPPTILARAGALAMPPEKVGGAGWARAFTRADVENAQEAAASVCVSLGAHPGNAPEVLASTAAAGVIAGSPVAPGTVAGIDPFLLPIRKPPSRTGAIVGSAPLASGRAASVRLPWDARERHLFAVGATGTGKSTLLLRLIDDDLNAGRSLVLLDPHGDLSRQVLERIPCDRQDDLVLIDADDSGTAGIDAFGDVPDGPEGSAVIAGRLGDAFQELYDPRGETEFIGPVFHRTIGIAVDALRASEHTAADLRVTDIERWLSDPAFREMVLARIPPGPVRTRAGDEHRHAFSAGPGSNPTAYFASKFTPLVSGPAAGVLGGRVDYRFEEVVANRGILICRLPLGTLGMRATRLLGRLVLSRVLAAIMARAAVAADERGPVSVVLDEAQTFAHGEAVEQLLAQGRKFGAAATLANQSPSQLGPTLPSVLTNCGSLVAFRLPRAEAAAIADRMPEWAVPRLPQLPRFRAVVVADDLGEAALVRTQPPPKVGVAK